MNQMMNMSQLT
jgi:hypothetical protein